MYEKYWGLQEKPFRNTPDPRFMCPFNQYSDAQMKLTYAVRENMGAAMMTGVFGCGKTLVIRALLASLQSQSYAVSYISHPPASGEEFLRSVVRHLKYSELPDRKSELLEDSLLEHFQAQVEDNVREGKETLVVLDEAHAVGSEEIFEKIRLLLNFQGDDRFLISLILVGQPELAGKVANLRQLEQRIAIRCHLGPLDREQATKYVQHRLQVAGREEEIFTPDALDVIFQESGGIPRRINHCCDLSLMTGFARKSDRVTPEVYRESREIFGGESPREPAGGEGGRLSALGQS